MAFHGYALILLLAAAPPAPVDFDTEVLPVLAKAGCNAGACHGAAAGRGGFKLSLFGGDPAADHRAIVRELEGRRVNLAHPERSLILLKPTWQLDHEGGERFAADSPQAKLLIEWIAAGAPRQSTKKLNGLRVDVANRQLRTLPGRTTLQVTAHFSDDSSLRVEDRAIYLPADPTATVVDEQGRVQVLRPGRHTIVVRYLTQASAVQISVAFPGKKLKESAMPRNNWIDEEINSTLAELRIPPAGRADDATLLRRVTLDLTGKLPTPDRVREFLANQDEHKFDAEVERLMVTPEFVEYWTYRLAEWLRYESAPREPAAQKAYYDWIKQQATGFHPLNKVVADLITATGDSHTVGPANFHRSAGDARAEAEHVAETLLAVRLRCANCHNHPLDRWTQDDYHGLAAIFARLDRGQQVRFRTTGEVIHPATGEAALPRIPGERFLDPQIDGREALAVWLASKKNPYFARAWVNRFWQALMGRGLVEPIDDLRDTNPGTHPGFLNRLADDFARDFDFYHLVRTIVSSAAYQRGRSTGIPDDRYYSQALSRAIPQPVLIRLICQTIEVPGELFDAARVENVDGEQLAALLEKHPLGVLACEARPGGGKNDYQAPGGPTDLSGELQWLNGPLLNRKLADPRSAFLKLAQSGLPNRHVIEEYYVRTLSRQPTPAELKHWDAELAGPDREKRCEDFAWSLLSCPEFVRNH